MAKETATAPLPEKPDMAGPLDLPSAAANASSSSRWILASLLKMMVYFFPRHHKHPSRMSLAA